MLARVTLPSLALIVAFTHLAQAQAPAGWEEAPDEVAEPDAAPAEEPAPVQTEAKAPEAKAPPPKSARSAPASEAPKAKAESNDEAGCHHGCAWHSRWHGSEGGFALFAGPARLRMKGVDERLQSFGYDP